MLTALRKLKAIGTWWRLTVKRRASIGSNATIIAGMTIGEERIDRRGRGCY